MLRLVVAHDDDLAGAPAAAARTSRRSRRSPAASAASARRPDLVARREAQRRVACAAASSVAAVRVRAEDAGSELRELARRSGRPRRARSRGSPRAGARASCGPPTRWRVGVVAARNVARGRPGRRAGRSAAARRRAAPAGARRRAGSRRGSPRRCLLANSGPGAGRPARALGEPRARRAATPRPAGRGGRRARRPRCRRAPAARRGPPRPLPGGASTWRSIHGPIARHRSTAARPSAVGRQRLVARDVEETRPAARRAGRPTSDRRPLSTSPSRWPRSSSSADRVTRSGRLEAVGGDCPDPLDERRAAARPRRSSAPSSFGASDRRGIGDRRSTSRRAGLPPCCPSTPRRRVRRAAASRRSEATCVGHRRTVARAATPPSVDAGAGRDRPGPPDRRPDRVADARSASARSRPPRRSGPRRTRPRRRCRRRGRSGPPLSPWSISARSSRIWRVTRRVAVDVAAARRVGSGDGGRPHVEAAAAREAERRTGRATARVAGREPECRRVELRHVQQGDVELRIEQDRDRVVEVAAEPRPGPCSRRRRRGRSSRRSRGRRRTRSRTRSTGTSRR